MCCQYCAELNYTLAMVNQLTETEVLIRKRQSQVNAWADVNELRAEVMKGLNITINQVDVYIEDLKAIGAVVLHRTQRGVKRKGGFDHIPCSHVAEIAA